MRVYISGKITGNPRYRHDFAKAQWSLEGLGFKVFNPCCIPDIFEYEQFMAIDFKVIEQCDAIYMMSGWEGSLGAKREHEYARDLGKKIIYEDSAESFL